MATATPVVTEPQAPDRGRSRRRRKRRNVAPWVMLTPASLVIVIITLVPLGFLVYSSFTDYDQRSLFTGEYSFIGFKQYVEIFDSGEFWHSVIRTVWFTAAMVIGTLVIGVGAAHLMTRVTRPLRYLMTIVVILAWGMPNVASSVVWDWLFEPGYGVVNWVLTQLHVFGDMTSTNWADHTALAFLAIWLLVVWQAVGFVALTVYAALTQMPSDPVEAARIDGANEWRIWWNVTLPFLRPTLLLVTILSIIWDTNVFNQIWLVSEGGPDGTTSTLGIYSYKTAFVGLKIGTGAAVSVVTTVLLLAVTAVYIRNLLRAGEDL